MAACGAGGNNEEAAALPAMADADVKILKDLLKVDWGKAAEFKGKGITGKIWKAKMAGFAGDWVKSDKIYEGVNSGDYKNYKKFMAETLKEDKTTANAENTSKDGEGVVTGVYWEIKMGMMIANRDMHVTITQHANPGVELDDMKSDEVTVWKDKTDNPKPSPKKVVRMKVKSFSLGMDTDKGYRAIDFDNYDFGGSLPTKITNKFVGNKADFITMAAQINKIKSNGGKYKK